MDLSTWVCKDLKEPDIVFSWTATLEVVWTATSELTPVKDTVGNPHSRCTVTDKSDHRAPTRLTRQQRDLLHLGTKDVKGSCKKCTKLPCCRSRSRCHAVSDERHPHGLCIGHIPRAGYAHTSRDSVSGWITAASAKTP